MSIEQIIELMDKLNMMHRSLLKLALQKTEVLKESNIEALNTTMKNEQMHIAAISKLEEQRQQAVAQFFEERTIQCDDATVSKLLEYADEKEKIKLVAKRDELLKTIDLLKEQNDLNQQLLFQSLQFVNLTLDLFQPQQEQMNYGASAGSRKPVKKGQFDSKA